MKKFTLTLMIMIVSLISLPNVSMANTNSSIGEKTEVPAEIQAKYDRLEEIKSMDRSEMTRAEKKELRKEVRTIKSELRSSNNGIYLSIGAIIIIILLLILLL